MAGNETPRIEIGGATYAAEFIAAKGLPEGVVMLQLSESIGDPDVITRDMATTYFSAGALLAAKLDRSTGYYLPVSLAPELRE